AENRAKFVPRPSQVAPSGCGAPDESRALPFWDEKNCSKRRNGKTNLGNKAIFQRAHSACIADIAAAVDRGIGVENFPPDTAKGHLNTIVVMDLRREVNDNEAAVVWFLSFA